MANQVGNIYKNLDPRVRLGVQVVGFAVGIYIIYRLIKGVNTFQQDQQFQSEEQSTANELTQLNKNPYTRQKITESQAKSYANKLYQAMNGLGTDEQQIYSVFYKLQNNADYLAIQNAFGTKTISSGSYFIGDVRGTMVTCLSSELDIDETKKVNDILRSKKIKFRI
jgi:hypothetical protein